MVKMKTIRYLGGLLVTATLSANAEWKPVEGRIMTRWAAEVDPAQVLPDYPRPQMKRESWTSLNGRWDFDLTQGEAAPSYERSILVPFPVESALSGVGKAVGKDDTIHYRRRFSLPEAMRGQRILLHFGAVDWEATVSVNGQVVGSHRGGYAPFSFDITDQLNHEGEQELRVTVKDPTNHGYQPRGKQITDPRGIWYTPVSGIWGTVWLEGVPSTSIDGLVMAPNIDEDTMSLTVQVRGDTAGVQVKATASLAGKAVAAATGTSGEAMTLTMADAALWSPTSPTLYDLKVTLEQGGTTVDAVDSYFGMRKIEVKKDAKGINRLFLNNAPLFQYGTLDQGWWPDGLYTAPTDAALRYDVEITRDLGFNMIRKHVKVEPARWYTHCDQLGMLVWQDMPNAHNLEVDKEDRHARANFYHEWGEIMDSLHNHPCIVTWVPFNEGWGQFDTEKVTAWTKERDPSRLVINASGWHDKNVGDIRDVHSYPGPHSAPLEDHRAIVLGEFGGLGHVVENHLWWNKKNWGYKSFNSREALQAAYNDLQDKLRPLVRESLAAAVYTQTTDVEGEVNGLMTYDREVLKFNIEQMQEQHRALIETLE